MTAELTERDSIYAIAFCTRSHRSDGIQGVGSNQVTFSSNVAFTRAT